MRTKNDTANRKQILQTARELYYERGMDEVSFDEIASGCGVTKSLIRYHFGSKAQLANELFGLYSKDQLNVFFKKAYTLGEKYTKDDIMGAYTIQSVRYYCNDRKALRFYTQLFSCSFTEITYGIEDVYQISTRKNSPADTDYRHMIYIGSQYAARGLIYHFATGEIKCSEKVFAGYILSQGLMHVFKKNERERILQNAFDILDRIEIGYGPGFTWN